MKNDEREVVDLIVDRVSPWIIMNNVLTYHVQKHLMKQNLTFF